MEGSVKTIAVIEKGETDSASRQAKQLEQLGFQIVRIETTSADAAASIELPETPATIDAVLTSDASLAPELIDQLAQKVAAFCGLSSPSQLRKPLIKPLQQASPLFPVKMLLKKPHACAAAMPSK